MPRKKPDDYTHSLSYEIPLGMLLGLSITSSVAATIEWLKWVRDELEEEVIIELDSVMERVRDAAIDLCPKETGALASSISIDNSGAIQAGDFYGNSISAGRADVINPVTGKSTDLYALYVHDGHATPNGGFWEGVPFLAEAMLMYYDELESAVDRAMKELGTGD